MLGHYEVTEYLIAIGADKNTKNDDGYTPLIFASKMGNFDIVKYLISVGANKDAENNNGETALDNALNTQIREYLLSMKFDYSN
ncbi:hypothetical protein TVAG_056610 [Trichomonas vaginalis G3]|uniref:Uncharacterized protein n=1 Tax=Trichomonas vaginalis (strain ATCC PRA-98 / G3) TaxID=412133 RepID=A2ECM0_TRIV3|nr:Ankyrin repeat family [Trichomonas vaginalis G3]EAY09617.1 hypothetical protein TVAG_056610 [Trichomonas vaginalis G3]KAI5502128.1 Ankyrin repeat family [Trichomonas vaginalis G3]|eukprot:XP_001321840.1 hypothetical protein [Trichomonas vaginalis G3]